MCPTSPHGVLECKAVQRRDRWGRHGGSKGASGTLGMVSRNGSVGARRSRRAPLGRAGATVGAGEGLGACRAFLRAVSPFELDPP